jgi:hypothetical protein
MYKCTGCGKTSALGERMAKVVTKVREVTHPTGHLGTQIVEEKPYHQSCAAGIVPTGASTFKTTLAAVAAVAE